MLTQVIRDRQLYEPMLTNPGEGPSRRGLFPDCKNQCSRTFVSSVYSIGYLVFTGRAVYWRPATAAWLVLATARGWAELCKYDEGMQSATSREVGWIFGLKELRGRYRIISYYFNHLDTNKLQIKSINFPAFTICSSFLQSLLHFDGTGFSVYPQHFPSVLAA